MSGGSAGIGFTGCVFSPVAAEGGRSAGTTAHSHGRRAVVVNGTRVKTVDIHAHCVVPDAMAVLGRKHDRAELVMTDTATRLAAMDEQGLDVAALSINPFWYHAGRDAAAELIRIQNEALVEICGAMPDRFVAFATAAWQHPDLAVEQVTHAAKTLGFRGVSVGCSIDGDELSELADWLPHPHYSVHLLAEAGLSLEIQNIALSHTELSNVEPKTLEGKIVELADLLVTHATFWEKAGHFKPM